MARFSFILLLLLANCLPTQAQWNKLKYTLEKASGELSYAAPGFPRTLAMQRAINQIALNKSRQQPLLQQSTLTVKLPVSDFSTAVHWENPKATAFVIEESFQGKKYLWGVTASHYFFDHPVLEIPAQNTEIPILFLAQGHYGLNDISLFPIPQNLQQGFTPLLLAPHPAHLGEKLSSAGYFDDQFHLEKNRIVTQKTPYMITTSLKVEDLLSREGACGGPVLNARGEVVGMHVGSSQPNQAGFAVPVKNIYDLLYAYHHQGKYYQPFYFKGRKLGEVNINESIKLIEVWKGQNVLDKFLSYQHKWDIDYKHLEKFINTAGADRIVLIIERTPFSSLDKDQKNHYYEVEYNLKTFRISKKKIK